LDTTYHSSENVVRWNGECIQNTFELPERNIQEIIRVGQNRIYTPYMTVHLVISLSKVPCIHHIFMVLDNPRNNACSEALSWRPTAIRKRVYAIEENTVEENTIEYGVQVRKIR
jgi:hypothetical protein